MKKRALAFLLGVALCVGLVGPAFALKEVWVDGEYRFEDDDYVVPTGTPVVPGDDNNNTGTPGVAGAPNPADLKYSITNLIKADPAKGTVAIDKTSAKAGETVTITVTVVDGYKVKEVIVKDAKGAKVKVIDLGDGKYSFVMPASRVDISVEFVAVVNPFTDVDPSSVYYDAILWAVENGITTGTGDGSTFSPNKSCNRAEIVTFLWRAYGKPAPTSTSHKFTDVSSAHYYYTPMLWAVQNGITTGTTTTTFSPASTCTRAQAMTFQYRAAKALPVAGGNSFTDVTAGAYYVDAVNWAVANAITTGTGTGTTFSPNAQCTRAQIVTFLYRELAQ